MRPFDERTEYFYHLSTTRPPQHLDQYRGDQNPDCGPIRRPPLDQHHRHSTDVRPVGRNPVNTHKALLMLLLGGTAALEVLLRRPTPRRRGQGAPFHANG